MTKIVDRVPIPDKSTYLDFSGHRVKVHRNQIVLWVSIHLPKTARPEPNIPKIPALLDTGNNFDFAIRHQHLHDWAGIEAAALRVLKTKGLEDLKLNCHDARVWLYPNFPGTDGLDLRLDPDRRQVSIQSRTWRRSIIRLLRRV